ncbi:MAG TPA: DNA cytosine methyltransferase [Sporichthyaceae bacterium]|nr:DNA cytosine methyltransferase [Sporichthyaceae bacterium]
MKILDLFCGAGGASMGYHRAGFELVGVDMAPQPEYPFEFRQADVMELRLDVDFLKSFDAIHASPPCQAYTALQKGTNARLGRKYPNLMGPVLYGLGQSRRPSVIENPAARPDVVLCGTTLGLSVIRHRRFELNEWTMAQPKHVKHAGTNRGWRHGVYRDGVWPDGRVVVEAYGNGGGKASVAEMQTAMDMPWVSTRHGLTEAIPPAFTECIGRDLLAHLTRAAVTA